MAEPLALGIITRLVPDPETALATIRALGIPTIQLSYPAHLDNEAGIARIQAVCSANDIEITTVFYGFEGEDYNDISTVRDTVGLVPEATRAERVAKTSDIGEFAYKLGVRRIAAHIGFVSHDDPSYGAVVSAVQGICDELAPRGQRYALETGQETAAELSQFLSDVARPNLFVNFDPANMILYGNDQPIPATETLFPYIDEVHCKDGTWPTQPGQLGHETALGEGDVDVPAWVGTLLRLGYRGTFTIEREISGEQQREDIARAVTLLKSLLEAPKA